MRSISLSAVLFVLAVVASACASEAGVLVSVNPHAARLPADRPPLAELADIPCVAVNAYHVSSDQDVERALGYPSHGKPKILSDDAGEVDAADAKRWIARTCEAGEHYEHYDAAIGPEAMSGDPVASLEAFPTESREVLGFIREEGCASALEPGGTLSREGTELLWNGEPISLVGHSWMGAVAGRNFDVEGYLDVLAAHRVNLTRVWVVEQWTALAVESVRRPFYANAAQPFAGSLADGTVDLGKIDPVYLERLRRFVREAAERGIVVQLTLFDRHGLLNDPGRWGKWRGSPYNRSNNTGDLFAPGGEGKAPPAFVDLCRSRQAEAPPEDCPVQRLHFELVRAVRDAVAGSGNVLLEVMNEPLAEEWGDDAVVAFHRWVAAVALGGGSAGSACFEAEPPQPGSQPSTSTHQGSSTGGVPAGASSSSGRGLRGGRRTRNDT